MRGKDLIAATLFGGGSGGGGGIPQADIDAAFAALAEKGVTVPDGATSADLDDLIASIVTGGGGGALVTTGTVTPAESVDRIEIEHNLGSIPRIAMCYMETQKDKIRDEVVASGTQAFSYSINNTYAGVLYKTGSSITSNLSLDVMATSGYMISHEDSSKTLPQVILSATNNSAVLCPIANSDVKFNAGTTYRWIMIAEGAA